MKKALTLLALTSQTAFGGICESDYETTANDDFAYVYTDATTLQKCLEKSEQYPAENFIFKIFDDGETIAVTFLKNGQITSTIPQ